MIALPHLGASTREAEDNCAVMVVDQVREYLEHGNVANAVNFPDMSMPRESPYRIAIANANVPNMVAQISTIIARAGLNIHNMLNKSKGEMAYTLVDVDSAATPDLVAQLGQIGGVLAVRYLPLRGLTPAMSKDLAALRAQIDALDERLLRALNAARRAGACAWANSSKGTAVPAGARSPGAAADTREERRSAGQGAPCSGCTAEIISACRALEQPLAVSYLGPAGTFSEMAVLESSSAAACARSPAVRSTRYSARPRPAASITA